MAFRDTMEYQRLIKRTDPDGCGGDCDNCDCRNACSCAAPYPDEYCYDEDDE